MVDAFFPGAALQPLAGNAGWVGAGLLGAVLAWLMLKHLPDKDRQIMAMIESRDAMVREVADQYGRSIQALIAHHGEQIAANRSILLPWLTRIEDYLVECIRVRKEGEEQRP